jgi:hypothetical protein
MDEILYGISWLTFCRSIHGLSKSCADYLSLLGDEFLKGVKPSNPAY